MAIHLGTMIYGVKLATEEMGPELMKEVMRFHKRQKNIDALAEQAMMADDYVRGTHESVVAVGGCGSGGGGGGGFRCCSCCCCTVTGLVHGALKPRLLCFASVGFGLESCLYGCFNLCASLLCHVVGCNRWKMSMLTHGLIS